jgi:hypothetical protein
MSIILWRRRFTSQRHKNGLFRAIVAWIVLAIIAYTLLSAIWGDGHGWSRTLTGWRVGATQNPLDRIKVTLTALGGVGAVGYLVIKYRERAAFERGEADEKLVRAVQQLGDASPQVRIAGVYALADVADTYKGPYHQRVVDILCGYLRTDRLLKDANGDTRYATNDEGTPDYNRPLSADGAVESTILSVLASHLRTVCEDDTKPGPWTFCHLNFQGAYITEQTNFKNAHFVRIDMQNVHFAHNVTISGSRFMQYANFKRVTFSRDTTFSQVIFEQLANFSETSFLNSSTFGGVTFAGGSDFTSATFNQVEFICSSFEKNAMFLNCIFFDRVWFWSTDFKALTLFFGSTFNIDLRESLNFPNIKITSAGLPERAKWAYFRHGTPIRSTKYDSDSLTDEQCQPDEVPPTGTLPQDEGGEADGN